jgi:hypothetical protein
MLKRVITDLWLPIPFAFSDLIPYTVLEVFTRKESPMAYEMPYGVRWPADLIERIRAEAKANERSVNREIVHRVRQSLEAQDTATQETAA